MMELIIAAVWISLGSLGTFIGLKTFQRRYGSEIKSDDILWLMIILGPLNLIGMMFAVRPWDRSLDDDQR